MKAPAPVQGVHRGSQVTHTMVEIDYSPRDVTMKKLLATAALTLPLVASATNLLSNPSFELGPLGTSIPSWTTFQIAPNIFPPAVISSPGTFAQFGTVVAPNPLNGVGSSPDLVGTQALYFVDDQAPSTVFQTLPFVAAGSYFVGFDYFIPTNGLANPANATLNVCFGPCFTAVTIDSTSTGGVWANFTTIVNVGAGATTFSFAYTPAGMAGQVFSKDIIVDRAFVVAVPEPSTYAMFGAGLLALGLFARRRSNKG